MLREVKEFAQGHTVWRRGKVRYVCFKTCLIYPVLSPKCWHPDLLDVVSSFFFSHNAVSDSSPFPVPTQGSNSPPPFPCTHANTHTPYFLIDTCRSFIRRSRRPFRACSEHQTLAFFRLQEHPTRHQAPTRVSVSL